MRRKGRRRRKEEEKEWKEERKEEERGSMHADTPISLPPSLTSYSGLLGCKY